jgi:putative transposase
MIRVHKIKLSPNNTQSKYFGQACGVARHAYNWALANWKEQFEAGLKPNEALLRKQYNAIKASEFPWARCHQVRTATSHKNYGSRRKCGD